jgi:protein SCO1/2
VTLISQEGKRLRFYQDLIKDRTVLIGFFYTHCKQMCPAETANLRRVARLLEGRIGKDIFFYSISIDPKLDSPRKLREYAEKFGVGKGWTFLTGKKWEVDLLRKKLGLLRGGKVDQQLSQHMMSVMLGNDSLGKWIRRSAFDSPPALARLLRSQLESQAVADTEAASFVKAQSLPRVTPGEELFRSRCASCHSLGREDGIGPGLAGVIRRRDRSWLAQWLKAPDRMLKARDPIASGLFERYRRVQMPNMELSDQDVSELLLFLENF